MSQSDFLRSVRAVPSRLRVTQEGLLATRSQVAEIHATVVQLHATLGELRDTVNAASTAQLEALRLLTRSINELSARIEKLEQVTENTKA